MAQDHIAEFQRFMESHGIFCPDAIVDDGQRHRFANGGTGQKNAWYRLWNDLPINGVCGDWKLYGDESFKFTIKETRQLSDEEIAERKRAQAARRKREQRENEEKHFKAAEKATGVWTESVANPDHHAYLARKGINAHVARVYQGPTHWFENFPALTLIKTGDLVIPVHREGKLAGAQLIRADENDKPGKVFLAGTHKEQGLCVIGKINDATDIVICEGYATASSIFEATELPTVVAFDAGNLMAVAKYIRSKMPEAKIIIAADDDAKTKGNPGLTKGQAASAEINGILRRPFFKVDEPERGTDFNDLFKLYGKDEVAEQIRNGQPTFKIVQDQIESIPAISDSSTFDLPDMKITRNGNVPKSTIRNLAEIFRRVDAVVRYNVISKKEEYAILGQSASVENQKKVVYARFLDICERFRMPTKNLDEYLSYLTDMNQYNPVKTWVESKPWDGKSRLSDLFQTITAKEESTDPQIKRLKCTLMRRWLISAIAAAYEPNGIAAKGVLVLQGDQNLGKTFWFKNLVPPELRELIADGKILDPANKDSVKQVVCYWLVELGEFDATIRKSDISIMKAFLGRQDDEYRAAYARDESKHPRRTIFFGSVNPEAYLADATGNVRYWTIACESINPRHGLDMQQIWAEVSELYKAGESWHLAKDEVEQLNAHNQDFSIGDPIFERVESQYDWNADSIRWRWMNATEILRETGIDRPTKIERNECAQAVRKLNQNQFKKKTNSFLIPPKKQAF